MRTHKQVLRDREAIQWVQELVTELPHLPDFVLDELKHVITLELKDRKAEKKK